MDEKYDERYEDHIRKLAEHRLENRNYRVLDFRARAVRRAKLPELVERGRSESETALVLVSADGDVVVMTEEFEFDLYAILKRRFI